MPRSKAPPRTRLPLVVLAVLLGAGAALFVRVHVRLAGPARGSRSVASASGSAAVAGAER